MLDIAPHHAHLVSDTAKVQTPIREQAQQGRIRVFYSKAVLGKVKPWVSKYCISGSHIYISNCNVPEGRSASFHRLTLVSPGQLWFSSHSIFLVGSILSALLAWPHPPHSFSELTICDHSGLQISQFNSWSFWPPSIQFSFFSELMTYIKKTREQLLCSIYGAMYSDPASVCLWPVMKELGSSL